MQDTETRTDLQRLIDWLKTYTGYNILGNFQVDYTDQILQRRCVPAGSAGDRAN